MTAFWCAMTVVSWGLWLVPLQLGRPADERDQTLFITLGNLVVAVAVAGSLRFEAMSAAAFWPAFAGGLVWAFTGIAAVAAVRRIGIAKAMGVWAPLNILVSMAWGAALFGEWTGMAWGAAGVLALGVVGMSGGIVLILFAGGSATSHAPRPEARVRRRGAAGLAAAVIAGVGWGSYFIPIRMSDASLWVAALPMAIGMAAGAAASLVVSRRRPSAAWGPRALAGLSGVMWSAGNYGSLRMMEELGTGRGFAIAQACVVVNALVGVLVFRRPEPFSRAGRRTLVGVALASASAVAVGLAGARR